MVHDRGQLLRELAVDRCDRAFECARQVAVEGDGALKRLLDERLRQFLRAIWLGLLGRGDDLIEQADPLFGRDGDGERSGSAAALVSGMASSPVLRCPSSPDRF